MFSILVIISNQIVMTFLLGSDYCPGLKGGSISGATGEYLKGGG